MNEPRFLKKVFLDRHISKDQRGKLSAVEFGSLPFNPRRIFFISEMPEGAIRGQHAHKICEQIIYVLSGSCEIFISSLDYVETVKLDSNSPSIYLPALTWCEISKLDNSTILAVLASHPYDVDDYITDFDAFSKEIGK